MSIVDPQSINRALPIEKCSLYPALTIFVRRTTCVGPVSKSKSHPFPRLEEWRQSQPETELTKETAFGNVTFVVADPNTNNIGND